MDEQHGAAPDDLGADLADSAGPDESLEAADDMPELGDGGLSAIN